MADLKTTVETAKDILAWFDTVKDTEISRIEIAYQLIQRAEVFYNLPLTEVFIMNSAVRRMLISVSTTRGSIRDSTPSGEELTLIAASSIIDGLKEIITLSEEPFEVVRLEDTPQVDIYGTPDNSKVVVFEDADTINNKDVAALLRLSEQTTNHSMFSTEPSNGYGISGSPVIGLYANKGPSAPGFVDFDGDVIKAYRLTLSSPIKRGPGKGRTRVVSRFISVFNQ